MRRELRDVKDETVLGWVDDDADPPFDENAARTLSGMRLRLGDPETVRIVLREGWSNGYLYLAEAS